MRAQQVPLDAAVRSLTDGEDVQSLSDDELIRTVEEADTHWREQYRECVHHPVGIAMYAPLMQAVCRQRYDRLAELRRSAPEPERTALTVRLGRLLTVAARSALAGAEALLLSERFRQAYEAFGEAEWLARALPDEGSLRLREILWARYGRWTAARAAQRREESESAHAGVDEIVQGVGPAAEACLQEIDQRFAPYRWVLEERARLRRQLADHSRTTRRTRRPRPRRRGPRPSSSWWPASASSPPRCARARSPWRRPGSGRAPSFPRSTLSRR
jgi:hypothetical protein